MALIVKTGAGEYTGSESVVGASVGITIAAPPPGFAIAIKRFTAFQSGGTSTQIRANYQSSVVAGSPDQVGVNRDLIWKDRPGAGQPGWISEDYGKGIMGGNGQQVTLTISGNVADSTLSNLFVIYHYVAVR